MKVNAVVARWLTSIWGTGAQSMCSVVIARGVQSSSRLCGRLLVRPSQTGVPDQ